MSCECAWAATGGTRRRQEISVKKNKNRKPERTQGDHTQILDFMQAEKRNINIDEV